MCLGRHELCGSSTPWQCLKCKAKQVIHENTIKNSHVIILLYCKASQESCVFVYFISAFTIVNFVRICLGINMVGSQLLGTKTTNLQISQRYHTAHKQVFSTRQNFILDNFNKSSFLNFNQHQYVNVFHSKRITAACVSIPSEIFAYVSSIEEKDIPFPFSFLSNLSVFARSLFTIVNRISDSFSRLLSKLNQ